MSVIEEERIEGETPTPSRAAEAGFDSEAWRAALRDDMSRTLDDPRWTKGLLGIAWLHLATFLICQILVDPIPKRDPRFPALWFAELVGVFILMRLTVGKGWIRRGEAIRITAKLWTTFLILSFNVVALNSLIGFERTWFKPVWGTLSTFFLASLAWLFTPLFFIPAVQMWLTGLVMVQFPSHAYLTYGVSWWIALTGAALWIRRSKRAAA